METIRWLGAVLGAVLLMAGLGWAWWRHRARLNEMQRRLAWNEQSRFELERHTQELDLRLASMAQTLKSLEAKKTLDEALRHGDTRSTAREAVPAGWRDTEPMAVDPQPYAETQPFAPDAPDLPVPPAAAGRPRIGR